MTWQTAVTVGTFVVGVALVVTGAAVPHRWLPNLPRSVVIAFGIVLIVISAATAAP